MNKEIYEKINTDVTEQLSAEINIEEASIWYTKDIGEKETNLIIKTITTSIKALIKECPLKLVFGKKDNILCVGVRIIDIPDSPLFMSKVQFKSEEHNALIQALQNGEFNISLINEMNKLTAWGKAKISKEKASEILKYINEKPPLYIGPYTKEVEYAHDCFCVSVEEKYRYIYPNAHTIPVMEIEAISEKWNTSSIYYYDNKEDYNFIINDKNEGGTFETEIAASLASVFPSTLYKNPKVKKGNNIRELTDILAYYEERCFLIEAKDISILEVGYQSNKEKRISRTQKQVKNAIKQLTGAVRAFSENSEIYTNDNKKINVNRNIITHCIILITEFIHEGDWGDVEKLLFEAIYQTGAIFNIFDLNDFIKLLKISSGQPDIIDYHLMQRCKYMLKNNTIHIKNY